jgi:hypothetical protein
MIKEFTPYQEALELKELGFDEPCFGHYLKKQFYLKVYHKQGEGITLAPIYSQAFRFFREKYGLHTWVGCKTLDNGKTVYIGNGRTIPNTLKDGFIVDIIPYEPKDTFEEAELACLRKLIEIVKK